MFAQSFHPAMRFAAPLRREIGVRTVFNILGPLTNPASANCHVLGTPNDPVAELLAGALSRLGVRHALVVSSDEGLDEISVSAPTTLFEVRGSEVVRKRVTAKDFGVGEHPLEAVRGGTAEENAEALRGVLRGDGSAALRDFIAVNAGAGLYVCGLAASLRQGTEQALTAIEEGEAAARVGAFVEATRRSG
jgi:anthranilate phosphoribosyltransferase